MMKAGELYSRLSNDFQVESMKDDWSFMKSSMYFAPEFRERYIGVLLDNAEELKKVYTACIPDLDVLDQVLDSGQTDLLLFSHHAMGYDPTLKGFPFYDIPGDYLKRLRDQRVSFYVLHMPLDKNGEFSTSVSLARHLDLRITGEFCEYEGIKAGVICRTDCRKVSELAEHVGSKVGHEIKLLRNGGEEIRNGQVAIAAGGGSVGFAVEEVHELGLNTYITGTTRQMPEVEDVREFHRMIEKQHINVIGATHYTTEKYACMAMVRYFAQLGIEAEFLEGRYYLEDL